MLPEADGVTAPEEAKDYVLSKLEGASDDLYAWAAARVARSPSSSFEDIMSEMATYGLGELADEATRFLEANLGTKAGSTGELQARETVWENGQPGKGTAVIAEELAGLLQQAHVGMEKRQCVTKAVAAGVLWRTRARATDFGGGRAEGRRYPLGSGASSFGSQKVPWATRERRSRPLKRRLGCMSTTC